MKLTSQTGYYTPPPTRNGRWAVSRLVAQSQQPASRVPPIQDTHVFGRSDRYGKQNVCVLEFGKPADSTQIPSLAWLYPTDRPSGFNPRHTRFRLVRPVRQAERVCLGIRKSCRLDADSLVGLAIPDSSSCGLQSKTHTFSIGPTGATGKTCVSWIGALLTELVADLRSMDRRSIRAEDRR